MGCKHPSSTNTIALNQVVINDAEIQYRLGLDYFYGQGRPIDKYMAVQCFRNAAMSGHLDGQFYFARCLETGNGIAQNFTEAVNWYSLAANKGHLIAITNLGYCYENGRGLEKNLEKAFQLYFKAATKGEMISQYNVGSMYAMARGVEKNIEEAVKWFKLSTEQGYPDAEADLGTCYYYGNGCKQDKVEAKKLFTLAALKNLTRAQAKLGVFYNYEEKNSVEALSWFIIASNNGNAEASELVNGIIDRYSNEEIQAVNIRVKELQQQIRPYSDD